MQTEKQQWRQLILILILLGFLGFLFLVILFYKMQYDYEVPKAQSFETIVKTDPIDFENLDLQTIEIYTELQQLAHEDDAYKTIYNHREAYPIYLLDSLLHNAEMLEFVEAYPDADLQISDELKPEELESECPLFVQWDKRWGYKHYGNRLIATSGCGPTSLSMAIVGLTGNKEATPYQLAQYSYENDYYVEGKGSKWSLMTDGAAAYGLTSKVLSLGKKNLQVALDKGKLLILAMGPGQFTSSGHFIVVYHYDETGFYINDPNSYSRSEKVWAYTDFCDEIRNIWAVENA